MSKPRIRITLEFQGPKDRFYLALRAMLKRILRAYDFKNIGIEYLNVEDESDGTKQ